MLSEKISLAGKTAFITGSSQGIGKGIALAMAEYGAKIILHYRKNLDEAKEVAGEIRKLGSTAVIVGGDLSRPRAVSALYNQVTKKAASPDILVLNASVQIPKVWQDITQEDFDIQVNANFRSTFLLMQRFAPEMVSKGWGRILTVGSVQQIKPHPSMMIYAATKSAVLNMVQNAAMQLADKGVTVNNLAPGVIGTSRIEEDVPEAEERISQRLGTPSGQIGDPEDCAAMAVLLCSEAGRFITGQNIYVDGGMSL
ncbi:SDR family NAD(P)-dependent oxidoreductase [Dyadobacter aurulentus]|uniref:SDR family NAD(P)-dependent oxidoreductase n=1 Tax=Dyadobacter sp. UC 10 TaxID=2605428 RepID=UPI0011F18CA9|nr:SDR family oxidoreductase [Dyadobacter sp. UC 10]KAA0992579.1 SDR family oxidoreductase [Dyadobacter sp. UC 10]